MLKKFKKFLKNTSGSILPTMALLTIPLGITIGAAVDYTNYVNIRNEVQTGIDAAGIATIKELPNILRNIPSDLSDTEYNQEVNKQLKEYAGSFLEANITSQRTIKSYKFDINFASGVANQEDNVTISAEIEYDTIFGGVNGEDGGLFLFNDTINETITSIVNTGNRTVEIALVMDNSGSMAFQSGNLNSNQNPAPVADRRITRLQAASRQLVRDVFDAARSAQLPQPVQFSIVPFSSTVNVGNLDHVNHRRGNRFLDRTGSASYHNENLDWVNTYRKLPGETVTLHRNNRAARLTRADGSRRWLTRLDIFGMLGTEWEGCVEMRPYPENILDTYQANNTGYNSNTADRLFVPYMVPDGPDRNYFNFYSNNSNRIEFGTDVPTFGRNSFTNNYIPDFYDYNPQTELAFPRFLDDDEFGQAVDNSDIDGNQITRTNWISKYQAYQGLEQSRINSIPNSPRRNRQLKQILNNVTTPTFEKDLTSNNRNYFRDSGPNAFCPDVPVLQLTDDINSINSTINAMEAHGGTNIQQGLTWGWRTLSQARPFNTGRSLNDADNRKILILLTDGNNQIGTENTRNNTQYSSWGFQRTENILRHATTDQNTHGRLLEGMDNTANTIYGNGGFSLANNPVTRDDYADLMNLHTNQACNNIKNDGITIYAIAFDVPDTGEVKALLENCAGPGVINGNNVVRGLTYYHDVIGLDLEETFAEIASSITAIRLTQ